METIALGRSGLKVTPICFGTWEFSGEWGPVDEDAARATIRSARDVGINFFDTAQAYGFGLSEHILGDALRIELRTNRDDIVIATKGGLRRTNGRLVRDSSPTWLLRGLDDSLRALGLDVIDLYQLHWPDPNTPIEDSVGALREAVDAGKIRHIGVSNFDVEQLRQLQRFDLPETLQPPFHMFRRDIERAVLPYCRERDIGVLVYGPLAHGLLTGTIHLGTEFHDADWRRYSPDFGGETLRCNLDVVEGLRALAADVGCSLPQLAIAWTLVQPGVDCAIIGASTPAHLSDSVAAADIRLSNDDLDQIERILRSAVPMVGPSPEGQPER